MTSSYRSSESASRSSLKRVPSSMPAASTSSSSARCSRTSVSTSSLVMVDFLSRAVPVARPGGGERAAAGAALAQQRRGPLDRIDLDRAGGGADGVGDPLGAGAAVADDGDPAQAEQDCAAGCVRIELTAQAAEC